MSQWLCQFSINHTVWLKTYEHKYLREDRLTTIVFYGLGKTLQDDKLTTSILVSQLDSS